MLAGQKKQVSDRWFSPSFAPDVAACLWTAAMDRNPQRVIHAGVPVRVSRYQIAADLGLTVVPVSHNDFPGLAMRPIDTTYASGSHRMTYHEGLLDCLRRMEAREAVSV
jgi:dTDP-4-dehydrorhamnose reductase